MVEITRSEAALIRKRFPDAHIRRTVHKKYCVEETRRVMEFLKSIRLNFKE